MLPFVIRLRFGWGFVSQRLKVENPYYEQQESCYSHVSERTSACACMYGFMRPLWHMHLTSIL